MHKRIALKRSRLLHRPKWVFCLRSLPLCSTCWCDWRLQQDGRCLQRRTMLRINFYLLRCCTQLYHGVTSQRIMPMPSRLNSAVASVYQLGPPVRANPSNHCIVLHCTPHSKLRLRRSSAPAMSGRTRGRGSGQCGPLSAFSKTSDTRVLGDRLCALYTRFRWKEGEKGLRHEECLVAQQHGKRLSSSQPEWILEFKR